ncbi:MAG: SsrA-binding protein SmpB [Endomicrobiales bacterium]
MEKKTVTTNRKAFHDYAILETFEAGMMLAGYEVKSLRAGDANLTDGMVRFWKDEAFLEGVHIAPYAHASTHIQDYDPRQRRKLLMHKQQIIRLSTRVREKGLTVVPLEIYFSPRGIAKVSIGLAKGKKTVDKRESLKKRDIEKETRREMGARR